MSLNFPISLTGKRDSITPALYYSDISKRGVHRINADGTDHILVVDHYGSTPEYKTRYAVHVTDDSLYYSVTTKDRVVKSKRNGTSPAFITAAISTAEIRTIRGDDTHIYWDTYLNGVTTIYRADLDGSNKTTITTINGILDGFVVDENYLYWSLRTVSRIYRSNKDGSNQQILVSSTGTTSVRQVAIDDNYIYWVNQGQNLYLPAEIRRANISDGSSPLILFSGWGVNPGDVGGRFGEYGIAVSDEYIFTHNSQEPGWSEIKRWNKDGSGSFEVIFSQETDGTHIRYPWQMVWA